MEVKAIGKFIRVSTRKARIPAQVIKGMNAVEAVYTLKYMPKGAAHHIKKVLESAIANATHNFGMKGADLIVSEVMIDKGPSLRRVEYKAKGSIAFYNRPMSHITVIVKDANGAEKKPTKAGKTTELKATKTTTTKKTVKKAPKAKKQEVVEVEATAKA